MSEVLYIQTEKNARVRSPRVCLGDVAKLACRDEGVLNRNKVRPVFTIPGEEPGRYVVFAMDLVRAVERAEENVEINHIGEANIVVAYEPKEKEKDWKSWTKTIFVCLVSFFGAAFSIMTFNMDVDTPGLFSRLYTQLTGEVSDGRTILELTYSLGIGLGVIFFFNHFGRGKKKQDPSPMEVQMRVYEEDVDKTLTAVKNREWEEKNKKKGAGE